MVKKNMISIGQVGIGQWGKNHFKILSEMDDVILRFYDIDDICVSYDKSRICWTPLPLLIKYVDALIITTPTSIHYEIAKQALENGVHVFIEKPVCTEVWQAEELAKLAKGLIIQVGHIERFNPAYQRLRKEKFTPYSILCQRLSVEPDRCNDVSVVLDLMIHDIDLVLDLMQVPIKSIDSFGDINKKVTAEICFDNFRAASLRSQRTLGTKRRILTVWPEGESFYEIDFQKRTLERNGKLLQEKTNDNLLELELKEFIESVRENKPPLVGIDDAMKSLKVAKEIEKLIDLPEVPQN